MSEEPTYYNFKVIEADKWFFVRKDALNAFALALRKAGFSDYYAVPQDTRKIVCFVAKIRKVEP